MFSKETSVAPLEEMRLLTASEIDHVAGGKLKAFSFDGHNSPNQIPPFTATTTVSGPGATAIAGSGQTGTSVYAFAYSSVSGSGTATASATA
jgi:hypothetical protein